jgi:FkbM family methyltransferase
VFGDTEVNAMTMAPDADAAVTDVERWRLAGLADMLQTRFGGMMAFRNDCGALTQSLRAYGEWAENETGFCARFIAPGDTVLDVGAYIGTHALAFAERVGPAGQVISFEAQPASFALLAHNVAGEERTNISVVNAAVSDGPAGASIMLEAIDIGAPRSFGSAAIGSAGGEKRRIGVPATTLDTLGLAACGLVKIDVEGMEDRVLRGASRLLAECAPLVYAECNAVDAGSRVITCLRAAGYDVWMHLADAFNPRNWRGNPANIFGPSKEAALVGMPPRHRALCRSIRVGELERFFEINTLDDLVAGMLLKPQYPREVLSGTSALRLVEHHA